MLKGLIHNLNVSGNLKGSFSQKARVFFTLVRFQVKNKFKRKSAVIRENFFGYKVKGYDYSALSFLFHEVFVSNEYYFQSAPKQPVIIDCGANIGMSVLYFKKLYPQSKIIAFEANPSAFKLLESNISDNKLLDIELHNTALYDKETNISFFAGDRQGSLVASIQKERGGQGEMKVRAEKLSSYLKNLDSVDLVKMDVEGAELNIVDDLIESQVINKPKEYIIEYHHNMGEHRDGLASFLQKFESHGFHYNIRADYQNANPAQDILIHFYKK